MLTQHHCNQSLAQLPSHSSQQATQQALIRQVKIITGRTRVYPHCPRTFSLSV
jgi:hypothetical protein